MMNARDFAEASVGYLDEYTSRLRRASEALPTGETWWRPHERALSFGHVLVHLSGNVHQWIVSALGGESDERDRASEFARESGAEADVLLAELEATVATAARTIRSMDDAAMGRTYAIQGQDVSGWKAVYHVVEHFSWHTGQATWIAKARAGDAHGIAFYDDAKVNQARNG